MIFLTIFAFFSEKYVHVFFFLFFFNIQLLQHSVFFFLFFFNIQYSSSYSSSTFSILLLILLQHSVFFFVFLFFFLFVFFFLFFFSILLLHSVFNIQYYASSSSSTFSSYSVLLMNYVVS